MEESHFLSIFCTSARGREKLHSRAGYEVHGTLSCIFVSLPNDLLITESRDENGIECELLLQIMK